MQQELIMVLISGDSSLVMFSSVSPFLNCLKLSDSVCLHDEFDWMLKGLGPNYPLVIVLSN